MKWRFSHMGCADLFKCSMFIFFCVLGTFMVLEKMFQIGYYCNNRIFCDPTQTYTLLIEIIKMGLLPC